MITIFNTLKKPNEQPLRNVEVVIELSWDTSVSSIPRDESNDFLVDSTVHATTDVDGRWEVDIIPNDTITPSDSVYKVTETLSSTNINEYYISVLASSPSESWVGDLLVAEPAWEA
jgi:hypothetical protein